MRPSFRMPREYDLHHGPEKKDVYWIFILDVSFCFIRFLPCIPQKEAHHRKGSRNISKWGKQEKLYPEFNRWSIRRMVWRYCYTSKGKAEETAIGTICASTLDDVSLDRHSFSSSLATPLWWWQFHSLHCCLPYHPCYYLDIEYGLEICKGTNDHHIINLTHCQSRYSMWLLEAW